MKLHYMKVKYNPYTEMIEVSKEWVGKNGAIKTKNKSYEIGSIKAISKLGEFLKLQEEKRESGELLGFDRRTLPPLMNINQNYIYIR